MVAWEQHMTSLLSYNQKINEEVYLGIGNITDLSMSHYVRIINEATPTQILI